MQIFIQYLLHMPITVLRIDISRSTNPCSEGATISLFPKIQVPKIGTIPPHLHPLQATEITTRFCNSPQIFS